MPSTQRPFRHAALAALAALLACGESPTRPGPFAALAADYDLQTIDGAPLPINMGSAWLFERRFRVHADGLYEVFDVTCRPQGEACPRQESASSGRLRENPDGTIDVGSSDYAASRGTLDSSGRLLVEVTAVPLLGGVPKTVVWQYQRR